MLAVGQYMSVQAHACIGGKSIGDDIRRLDYGVHCVSGTPGRVYDMIRRRNLRTREIKTLILDECDEMLNQGFKEQIYDIYRYLPPTTQVCVASCIPFSSLRLRSLHLKRCPALLLKCVSAPALPLIYTL